MNRSQLEASVTKEYGTKEPSKYLQKFINLWVSLPKVQVSDESTTKVYIQYCAKEMGMEWQQNFAPNEWMGILEELALHYNLSLREIERSLTNVSFILKGLKNELSSFHKVIAAFLCIIKVKYTDEYNQLAQSEINHLDLFTKTRLTDLADGYTHLSSGEKHHLTWALRYCLIDEKERKSFLEQGTPFGASEHNKRAIQTLSQ
jgi:hypothetical protein